MIPYRVTINGIQVSAAYSERSVRDIFLPLLAKLSGLQRAKGRRILVMLAAPPGAGKSTLLSFLEELSRKKESFLPGVQAIGMDGFHRRQEYLQHHFIERDGKTIPMVRIKGAPVTFDLAGLKKSLESVSAGDVCGWPVYDRLLHNPVSDAVTVSGDIILLEGNYLLLDKEGWRDLSAYADYTISVAADEAFLRKRLIDRRIRTGVDADEAVRFVDFSDMPNVRLCLQHSKPADLELRLDPGGEYSIRKMVPEA